MGRWGGQRIKLLHRTIMPCFMEHWNITLSAHLHIGPLTSAETPIYLRKISYLLRPSKSIRYLLFHFGSKRTYNIPSLKRSDCRRQVIKH
ncbi:uncharacterized protein EAE97_002985 [Botrytis byssoidea]|uniref:Uncharacterized protein n=1 Tax=Botrytis byssoidea TaxID=139641 RepID=A0A9P5M730_9HELO|nr:uncharacterized protein EAE97_002985 [Botrytis byssoidea]KAF7949476.1 hypothetical protein EAE97_002985 [Botrytis byssoidea]